MLDDGLTARVERIDDGHPALATCARLEKLERFVLVSDDVNVSHDPGSWKGSRILVHTRIAISAEQQERRCACQLSSREHSPHTKGIEHRVALKLSGTTVIPREPVERRLDERSHEAQISRNVQCV